MNSGLYYAVQDSPLTEREIVKRLGEFSDERYTVCDLERWITGEDAPPAHIKEELSKVLRTPLWDLFPETMTGKPTLKPAWLYGGRLRLVK